MSDDLGVPLAPPPLGHEFVPPYPQALGGGYPADEGCAFIVEGATWVMGDPVRCRKSKVEHSPVQQAAAPLVPPPLDLQRENELLRAQLRGMRDFLSGQPKEFPRDWPHGEAKESQLNLAWTIGYDGASQGELFLEMVRRADKYADQLEAALRVKS
jgi:hypothetical protein